MEFEKTRQRVDSYTLNAYGTSIELKYRIKTYQYIENQDKKYLKVLRDAGAIITTYRKMDAWKDKAIVKYYMLVDDYIVPFEERVQVVEDIMNTEIDSDGVMVTIRDFINHKWDMNTKKQTSVELMDKEAIMLDYLSSYIVADLDDDGMTIISPEKLAEFDRKISYGLSNSVEEENPVVVKKPIKAYDPDKIPNPKPAWKSSRTYRFNDLFSFDNGKQHPWNIRLEREFELHNGVPITRKWCKVTTKGNFKFEGSTYRVDSPEYDEVEVDIDSYKSSYAMEEVLAIKQGNKLKFYNQDIFEIDESHIAL